MYKEDWGYANSRLAGTIVRKGSQPISIIGVNGDGTVQAQTVITKREKLVHMSELNLASPPLGMVNTPNGAVYVARKPMRNDWRQGLRRGNIAILSGRADVTDRLIYRTIRGKFPKLHVAIEDCMEQDLSVAFHRHWAVRWDERTRTVKLKYKWFGFAGTIDVDTHQVNLQDSDEYMFSHLQQALEEVLSNVD